MSAVADAAIARMTTEEMLALPENGAERWLIRGQLREMPLTVRNRLHSRIMARVAQLLNNWLDSQAEPRGEVLCGEAGCRLRRDPERTPFTAPGSNISGMTFWMPKTGL